MAKVFFILPVYNEEDAIYSVVESIARAPLPSGFTAQVLAIDDGSRDRSLQELLRAKEAYPVEIISYSPNRGVPAVFSEAFNYLHANLAEGDAAIIMESDGTSDVERIPQLLDELERGADVVIASRHVPGGKYVRFPWYRTLGSSVVNLFLRILWGIPGVKDYTIFFRAYRGSLLRRYIPEALPFKARKSFAVNGEILLRLSSYTSKFREIPLRYDYGLKKGKSKMRLLQTLVEYIYLTPKHHLGSFLKVGVVGGTGAILQALLLVLFVERGGWHPVIANTIAAEIAIFSNFVLNSNWTFRAHARGPFLKSFALFNLSALASVVIQAVIIWLGITLVNESLYLLYAAIGIGIGWITSYLLYSALIWKKKHV
jgi:dolichol-phosphate mannosyltransferase